MGLYARKQIVNEEDLQENFDSFRDRRIKLEIPALEVEKEVTLDTFDKLRSDIFELSKRFPHSRIAVTYKTFNEEVRLEIHPITGAA